LKPGDQMSTGSAVTAVSVGDEIAWSKDAARYDQLLRELASLRKDLDARVPTPGLRYGSKSLDRLPDGTILYVAIPNITESLVTAKQVFEEHVAQSGALQDWWNQNMSSPERRKEMDEAFLQLRELGNQLGDEIVMALAQTPGGSVRGPILLAEVKDRSTFKSTLAKDLKSLKGERCDATLKFDGPVVRIEFAGHHANGGRAGNPLSSRAIVPWDDSPFRAKLDAAYSDGTSWLFAVDLKAMLAQEDRTPDEAAQMERMGVLDAEYLIVERTELPDGADMHAELSFDQPRRGVAGWLAAPAPMGAADFVSPDAAFAAAAVLKRPDALLAELLTWVGPGIPDLSTGDYVATLQALAATMGGDAAIALDGPVLPIPSWKLAIEVYDPTRFQAEYTNLTSLINDRIAAEGQEGRIVVESEDIGNRTDWVVRFTGPESQGNAMRYTFADGYLIAAPSRVLIDRAIEQRANNYTLTRSSAFTALLPTDGHVNMSAFAWEHLGPSLGPLTARLAGVLPSEEMKALESATSETRPHLVTAYAEDELIVFSSRGETGLGSLLDSIITAHPLGTLGSILEHAQKVGEPTNP
jgi:hypothetical protein